MHSCWSRDVLTSGRQWSAPSSDIDHSSCTLLAAINSRPELQGVVSTVRSRGSTGVETNYTVSSEVNSRHERRRSPDFRSHLLLVIKGVRADKTKRQKKNRWTDDFQVFVRRLRPSYRRGSRGGGRCARRPPLEVRRAAGNTGNTTVFLL